MSAPSRDLPAFLEDRQRSIVALPVTKEVAESGRLHVPGEAGLWVFLIGDMTLFGLFFVGFVAQMSHQREVWVTSAARLHQGLGTVNTVVLLVSSYLVSRAIASWNARVFNRTRTLLICAAALGTFFGLTKVVEYVLLVREGISPTTNLFFTYYFVLTGIHLLHVVIGVSILLVCARRVQAKTTRSVEGSASYWHMVDILWVVLFPLLYFVGTV